MMMSFPKYVSGVSLAQTTSQSPILTPLGIQRFITQHQKAVFKAHTFIESKMKRITPLRRAVQTIVQPATTHPFPPRTTCHLQSEKPTDQILLERCILNPEHSETCQSGTDEEVGRHNSPYDPKQTRPEQEHRALEEEYRLEGDTLHDPLYISPANRDFSLILDPMAGPHVLKHLRSVRGWTNKHKQVLLKTTPYELRKYESVFAKLRKPGEKNQEFARRFSAPHTWPYY